MTDGPAEYLSAAAAYSIEPLSRATKLRVIAAVLAFVLVLTGFEVGVRVVPPDAMQVWAFAAASGHTLARASVTDARTSADLYALVNSTPTVPWTANYSGCPPPSPDAVTFDVVFIRWSLPIEDATLPGIDGCGLWSVSQGGIPSTRTDSNGQTQAILSELRSLLPAFTSP
jgi:hypothetical protein